MIPFTSVKIFFSRKLIVALSALVFMGISYMILLYQEDAYSTKLKILKSNLTSVKNELTAAEKKQKLYTEFYPIYVNILSKKIIPAKQLGEITERITIIRLVMDSLKIKHKLSSVDVNCSTLSKSSERFGSKKYEISGNKCTIKFAGLSDKFIYAFANDIIDQMPGYVKIDYIKIAKINEINDSTLVLIKTGQLPKIVEGELVFNWRGIEPAAITKPAVESEDTSKTPGKKPQILPRILSKGSKDALTN